MQPAAALTVLQSDPEGGHAQQAFFLKAWVRYYVHQLGRAHCYVISAGAPQDLLELVSGCSVVRLPSDSGENLARRRGRIMTNMVAALGQYYTHVIVGDPRELVLVDPAKGDLNTVLRKIDPGQVLTPFGLELVSQGQVTDTDDLVRYVRIAPDLSKPCVISAPVALSRDGTLTKFKHLATPDDLYLLELTAAISSADLTQHELTVGFGEGFAELRAQMHASWGKHGSSGYWAFELPVSSQTCALPARFDGLF